VNRLFRWFSWLSLLFCLTIAALWVRSYWIQDSIAWTTTFDVHYPDGLGSRETLMNHSVFARRGKLFFWRSWDMLNKSVSGYDSNPASADELPYDRPWWCMGFGRFELVGSPYPNNPARFVLYRIPLYAVFIGGVIPPIVWMMRRRRIIGIDGAVPCQSCGYDLRASPLRCPECGAVVPAKAG